MRKLTIGIIVVIIVIAGAYASSETIFSNNSNNSTVVTYGETTINNPEYKTIVDDYFSSQNYRDLGNVNNEVITANEVNAISQDISHRTYNSNQIYSSALVDLASGNDLSINVDTSKITLVTENMYRSALESAGITQGHVIVTSPVSATGESALAGIMASYESATNTTIPDKVKEAANNEVYTEAEIVNNSNVSADDLTNVVDDVKQEVANQNTTDYQVIINIINQTINNYNINLSQEDIENLAQSIQQSQQVQDQAADYQSQISNIVQNTAGGFSLGQIFNF